MGYLLYGRWIEACRWTLEKNARTKGEFIIGEVKTPLEAVNEVRRMSLLFNVQGSSTSADMTLPSANKASKKPASLIGDTGQTCIF